MKPKRLISLTWAALALLLAPAGAYAVAAAAALPPLMDNGTAFITKEARLPLRCLDAQGLLALPVEEQTELLNKAAVSGFNAVSFDAPLYGPQGLVRELGKVDGGAADNLKQLLAACGRRRLYAFPVLWTPASADALVGTRSAQGAFWSARNSLGWQAWSLRELAKLGAGPEAMTNTSAVGGWILYRGPWPDGAPVTGRPAPGSPTAEARLRAWAGWQMKLLRKAGFTQRAGLGLWVKQDLGTVTVGAGEPSLEGAAADGAPFSELSSPDLAANTGGDKSAALDTLPPVPGYEVSPGSDEDVEFGLAPPRTPWDLEGLDWDQIEAFIRNAPLGSQIDFLELTVETEDWYRVGDRLAAAAGKAEVPVLWRQDWRTASRYERQKHLEAPEPLAGLVGPWPDEDWPGEGESIWPPEDAGSPPLPPFAFRHVKLVKEGAQVLALVELNRPAALTLRWGKAWPLTKETASKGRAKAELRLPLPGVEPGQWVLLQARATAPHSGAAVARARWLRSPK
jgi:hypothetical protein